jgi:hypothetical protein
MSTENKSGAQGSGSGDDSLTNVKAEFNRKIDNLSKQLEDSNKALLAQLQVNSKAASQTPAKDVKIEDKWFDAPAEAAEAVISKAEERILGKLDSRANAQTRQNEILGEMFSEFPELNNKNHELTKRAVEIYSTYGSDEKMSPIAYKTAILQAAQEKDMKPVSKRTESEDYDTDGFSIGGSSSNSSRNGRKGNKDLNPATKELAEIMGIDIKDKDVVERLKNNHGRRSWGRYE